MNNNYENIIKETGLNKKNIVFLFAGNDMFPNIVVKFIQNLNIHNRYSIDNFDSFVEIIESTETDKLNNDDFLFYFIADHHSDVCLMKSIKYFIRNNINNYRLFSFADFDMFNKIFYKNYLANKGIDVSGQVINIDNFIFDNILIKDYQSIYQDIFNWGDLILPTFFDDYSMIEEGLYEYGSVVINSGDIVFDCGASIGSFSAFALSKKCELHAFEPIPKTFLELKYNLRHYKDCKKYLNNYGLSNRKGSVDFYTSENTGSDGYVDSSNYKEKINCDITTIDEYVKENDIQKVDFIKSDIEGAERDMLVGAINTIRKYKPKLSICTYHLNDDPIIIEALIKNACSDYKIIHKWGKCYAYL